MEGIVVGIAQINFHQSLNAVTDENSAPNFVQESSSNMTATLDMFHIPEESPTTNCDKVTNSIFDSLSGSEVMSGDSGWEEIEDEEGIGTRNKKGYTLSERRQMPSRASKESSLLGIKRRTIMKPSKRIKTPEDFQNLKPSDIRKIYLNKKLTNFKPSNLETIFEETPSTLQNNEQNYLQRLMGGRKIKRSLTCSDGFRYNKTLVNKRRAKIKKTFGKRFALKKISLEEFITKLNRSIEGNVDNETNFAPGQECENEMITEQSGVQDGSSKVFASNIVMNTNDNIMPNIASPEGTLTNFNMSFK
ncbi:tantalus [Cochliomyia hominivorax]